MLAAARSAFVAATLVGTDAWSQGNWPTGNPITYMVPFAPGDNTDTLARLIAPPLGAALGTQVIVENRAGAGGSLGSGIAARAPADGYTVLGSTISSHSINVSLYSKLDYDPVKSFEQIGMLALRPARARRTGRQPVQDAR